MWVLVNRKWVLERVTNAAMDCQGTVRWEITEDKAHSLVPCFVKACGEAVG